LLKGEKGKRVSNSAKKHFFLNRDVKNKPKLLLERKNDATADRKRTL
jgi:hypothetical protein